jgi:hypothetical protein
VLSAKFTIQITADNEWVRVPLELHEGVLRKFRHEYKPDADTQNASKGKAGFDRFDRKTGVHWWFHGKGQHVLTLDMIVPIKKASGTRRLQLAVPSAASSYLRLDIPIPKEQLAFDTILAGANKTTALNADSTQVELFRLEQRVDLGWRALPDTSQVKTLLKAQSEIRVEPTEESILLNARQLIEPLQGSMKEIEVTLPGGFTVLELKVDGETYQPLEEFPKAPQPVKISLPAPTTNRVRLDWVLQTPWPKSGQLAIEGLSVSECLRQSGEIAVVEFEGFRLANRSMSGVYRTNVRELLGPGPIQTAFQFREQPFQILLELLPIQPTYSVRPHLFLKLGGTQIEMLADLNLEVYRGVLDKLELVWPDFEEQGWTIDRTELPGLVEDIEHDAQSGRLTFQLAKRLGQGSQIRFLLKATRKFAHSSADAIPLTLPRVMASNPVRTVVVVTNQENVESTVTPVEGTETQPLSANFAEEVDSILSKSAMSDFRGVRQTGFLVRSDQQSFQAKIVTHPQSIHSETQLHVNLERDRIAVREELHYDVSYVPVSQLRVMVPNSFPDKVQFAFRNVALKYEWTGVVVGDSRQARLTLPKPELGEFTIVGEYQLPENAGQENRLVVPYVRASDAEEVTGRIVFSADYPAQATVEDAAWSRSPELGSDNVWSSTQLGDSVAIAWTPKQESHLQSFKIQKALVQSAILQNGRLVSRAYYQLDEPVEEILMTLPPEKLVPKAFTWNGAELSETEVALIDPDAGTFRLTLAAAEEGAAVLGVAYHATELTPLNWSQVFELTTPRFPGDVWMEKTSWEIVLPSDQHLFTLPEGFTPEFSWRRQGLLWARLPNTTSDGPETWTRSAEEQFPLEGNVYRFGFYGPCAELSFTAMNRSIIVLFGAGLALLVGFLLLKVPFTRNILTVLFVMFLFALCSVWFMEAIQVLLQPAALGLVLAVVAVLLEGSIKNRRQAHALSMAGSEEYSGSALGRTPRGYPEPIGSEDPTAVRPSPDAVADSQATQHRALGAENSSRTPPALIGSSLSEKSE